MIKINNSHNDDFADTNKRGDPDCKMILKTLKVLVMMMMMMMMIRMSNEKSSHRQRAEQSMAKITK